VGDAALARSQTINQNSIAVGKASILGFELIKAVFRFENGPGLIGCLDKVEEVDVLRADHACVDEQIKIDELAPELTAEQQDGPLATFAGLNERHGFEQLV